MKRPAWEKHPLFFFFAICLHRSAINPVTQFGSVLFICCQLRRGRLLSQRKSQTSQRGQKRSSLARPVRERRMERTHGVTHRLKWGHGLIHTLADSMGAGGADNSVCGAGCWWFNLPCVELSSAKTPNPKWSSNGMRAPCTVASAAVYVCCIEWWYWIPKLDGLLYTLGGSINLWRVGIYKRIFGLPPSYLKTCISRGDMDSYLHSQDSLLLSLVKIRTELGKTSGLFLVFFWPHLLGMSWTLWKKKKSFDWETSMSVSRLFQYLS